MAYTKADLPGLALWGMHVNNWTTYVAEVYDNADQELKDLIDAGGALSNTRRFNQLFTMVALAAEASEPHLESIKEAVQELQVLAPSMETHLVESENGVTRELTTKLTTAV